MPDMTAQEIVTAAYRKRGTTNAPNSVLSAAGLQDLQNMMASWSAEGLVVPYYTTENFTLTVGQAVYTIGSGGDFNTARPLKIVNAFVRVSNIDYPVRATMTKSEYNALTSKDLEGRPGRLYYDPQYPLGKIKFNYEADTTYDFHMVSEKPLTELATLGTTISLPREVNEALVYNLAVRLAPDKDIKVQPQVFIIAETSKETLEKYNALEKLDGKVTLDNALIRNYGNNLNIYSDGWWR